MADWKKASLSTQPITLDPNEYFNTSPEFRRQQKDRLAMQANLKRQYQLQLNNPHRTQLIEDPALNRWVYARNHTLEHFRPTLRTSLLGILYGVVPLCAIFYALKRDRWLRSGSQHW
uniref:NADH dehydrogenase [ubiquinone] 1 beta subcomplex subunit 4 n=1 Tax=Cynoglossus semilaevis TaxID=244447 RepID=A0A3P8VW18_CYNSE